MYKGQYKLTEAERVQGYMNACRAARRAWKNIHGEDISKPKKTVTVVPVPTEEFTVTTRGITLQNDLQAVCNW